jgi:hypothetical protein
MIAVAVPMVLASMVNVCVNQDFTALIVPAESAQEHALVMALAMKKLVNVLVAKHILA